jgi:membrane-anchored protein YejM (alkaline phosphatase superfamily)
VKETYSVDQKTAKKEEKNVGSVARNYFLIPTKSGIFGFATFFTILVITKLLSFAIGTAEQFTIDIYDVLLSGIGFILVFLIRFLENFKEDFED